MDWKDGAIEGCDVTPFKKFHDQRGWLAEIFRRDELPEGLLPAMGYLSMTEPGVARGPHAHRHQTDLFAFFHGTLRVYLWDAREASPTYGCRMVFEAGHERPLILSVPPGVVHAYRNVGDADAVTANFPNQLYAGEKRREPVDEIRYEETESSPFQMD
jgi:dTDP-4-dehydrorhamnose 3,5-epimerase